MTAIAPSRRRPCDRIVTSVADRRNTVLDVIRSAQHQLALSIFRCNDQQIFSELHEATRRAVKVNVLVTSRVKGGPNKIKKLLTALDRTGASVHAYTDPVVKYHAKYLVADTGPAVIASGNFTRKCFERTCDALVVTSDPDVVSGLKELMAADCEARRLPASITSRLVIGPERARRQLTGLIDRAQSSIRLIDVKLSDPDLITRLNARRTAGIRVEIFGSRQLGKLESHGKILLIDDRLAVVGGLALAALSLDFRREVAIIIEEAEAVAEVGRLFREIATMPTAGQLGAADPEAVL